MTIKRLTALLLALLLAMSLAACGGEDGDTTTDTTTTTGDATTTTTTAAPLDEATKKQMVKSLMEACASMTAYAVEETVQVSFEMNGNIAAASKMDAKLTVTPDGVTALCEQELADGLQSVSLYSTGERLYVADGDYRFTLELPLDEALRNYGAVTLKRMPGFDSAALGDAMTLTESEGGYTLSCTLSGNAVKGELATLAQELLGEMSTTLEDADVTMLAVTAELATDGTPRRIAYAMTENALSDGNFYTISAAVDATFTAVGDAVTLTPPADLGDYQAAETEYNAIVNALRDENGKIISNAKDIYDSLVSQYGKELVDSVLYMLGVAA